MCGWTVGLVLGAATAFGFAQGFTIEQALSAPFCTELRAGPAGGQVSWVADIGGRRNLWVAQAGTPGSAKQVTHYTEDDGQEISSVDWTPDGSSLVYVRGGDTEGLNPAVPNPADFVHGAKEEIWVVSVQGGEPRLLAEGHGSSSLAGRQDGRVCVQGTDMDRAARRPESQA